MIKLKEPENINYAAQIVKISVLNELANSDNLLGAPLLGMQAIVSKNTEVGTVGVLFVAETQLSDEYTAKNNLYRHHECNEDKDKTGFIEDNRRVKAIKLRGNRSDALFMPLSSLAYTKVDLSELKVGDAFEELNGYEICKKFERAHKSTSMHEKNKNKIFTRVDEKMFPRHYETTQYYRVLETYKPYTDIVVTQKLHGCIASNVKVLLADGTQKKISTLVNNNFDGYVMGVDNNGSVVPSKVVGVSNTGRNSLGWLDIRVSGKYAGKNNRTSKLIVTPDHKIYSPDHIHADNDGYVEASNLRPNDIIFSYDHTKNLSYEKEQILIGKNLGDGSISFGNGTAKLTYGQIDKEYVETTKILLGDIASDVIGTVTSGYGSKIYRNSTHSSHHIFSLFDNWYKTGTKQVPQNIKLGPIAMAFWYMDDGSLSDNYKQQERLNIATNGFSEESVDTLISVLKMYDINAIKFHANGWRIRMNKNDADIFFSIISPYIVPSMQYKLPERFRNVYNSMPIRKSDNLLYKVKVLSIEDVTDKTKSFKYDLQTETNNFIAGGIVVHNSLLRFSNIPVKRELTLLEKIASKLGVKVQKEEYDHIYGSNRVIKDANNDKQEHFYEHDIWTEAAKKFDDVVPENFVVYGELIGWTPDGQPIQKHYTYQVPRCTNDFYVYRVAQINGQGILTDLSWDQVKEWCRDRNIKTVPELWRGKHQDFKPEEWLDTNYHDKLHGGYTNAVPLADESPCDEGICIRIDGLAPYITKLKSPEFFAHETKMLDEDAVDMEEEGKIE